ncbi:hypothetical protein EG328_002494 [Venturia inaequalis]|uniref:DUF3752 domain-containing protein n=3 Tax=Venturia inaequalis TaxID=5025 RepID=A0A8H3V6Y7_VENIN|nr:hypothetical protein EG327_005591 [Venturia inaequalis]KAE9987509.1 hypothetical protein EG328_002494 [Venturia inaequalis]RDI89969.1 hypothetical protein Vi05172_g359 [Venturia inaequalis]
MSSIGPDLPPHLLAKRKRQAEEEEAATSNGAKPNTASSPRSPDAAEKRRRVMGPAPPPAPLDQIPPQPAEAKDEDSSSDDEWGPSLPTDDAPITSKYDKEPDYRDSKHVRDTQNAKQGLQRDDWMMMPPTQDGLLARMDPTKLRPGKFRSGKAAGGPAGGGIESTWTETPEQKRKRLENEMLGIAAPANSSVNTAQSVRKEDEDAARRIKEYNEKHRGKSLYDEHKKTKPEEKEDDPSKRAFDREKDVGGGMKIGHAKRKEMVNRAADFTSKFAGGGFL